MLPAVATSKEGHCHGSIEACTCGYILENWRGSDTGATYCGHQVRDRIGHLFSPHESAPQVPIWTLCPATCASYYVGPCATTAPPSPPPSPAVPPFAPCADTLPGGAPPNTYCEGAPCTCEYILTKWRGEDSGEAYCDYLLSERLGHLFPGGSPEGFVHTICPATCAAYGAGPCATMPRPPPPPNMPPFPPCSDLLHELAENKYCAVATTSAAGDSTADSGNSPNDGSCTCAYVMEHWRGEMSPIDYCLSMLEDHLSHLWNDNRAPIGVFFASVCEETCASHGVGACAANTGCESAFADNDLLVGGNALAWASSNNIPLTDESCPSLIPVLVAGYNQQLTAMGQPPIDVFHTCARWYLPDVAQEVPFAWPDATQLAYVRHTCHKTCCEVGAPPTALPTITMFDSIQEAWQGTCCSSSRRRLLAGGEDATTLWAGFLAAGHAANRALFAANPDVYRQHVQAQARGGRVRHHRDKPDERAVASGRWRREVRAPQ